jgi:hypothetical protein
MENIFNGEITRAPGSVGATPFVQASALSLPPHTIVTRGYDGEIFDWIAKIRGLKMGG